MKTRSDYVTNSSSSSFVITLKNGKTHTDFKEAVEQFINTCNLFNDTSLSYEEIFYDMNDDDDVEITLDTTYDNSVPHIIRTFLEDVFDAEKQYNG